MTPALKRVFPFPLLSVALFVMWLLLNQSVSPGHLVLGALAGLLAPLALKLLEPAPARIRHPLAIVRLGLRVLPDIIRSNIAVATIIVGLGRRNRRAGFVDIPLELTNANGLAVLACIITATPGTIWVNYNGVTGTLTIHVLDLVEEQEWIDMIKRRYEALLLEIFA